MFLFSFSCFERELGAEKVKKEKSKVGDWGRPERCLREDGARGNQHGTQQPCGLFLRPDKLVITNHFWTGLGARERGEGPARCMADALFHMSCAVIPAKGKADEEDGEYLGAMWRRQALRETGERNQGGRGSERERNCGI